MRSLRFISVALSLHLLAASALKDDGYDATTIVTTTRTVTVCPIMAFATCEPEIERPWLDWANTDHIKPTTSSTRASSTLASTSTKSGSSTAGTNSNSNSNSNSGSVSTSATSDGTRTPSGTTTGVSSSSGTTGTDFSNVSTSTISDKTISGSTTASQSSSISVSTTSDVSVSGSMSASQSSSISGSTTPTASNSSSTISTSSIIFTSSGPINVTSTTTTLSASTTTSSGTQNTTVPCPTGPGYFCPKSSMGDKCNSAGDRKVFCGKSVKDDTHDLFFTGETREYTLALTQGFVDADGAGSRPVYLINGKTPGEAIEANWGDMIVVHVDNRIGDNITSIHWHGVRQVGTNDQDGVPGVTECGIAPGTIRTYRFHASSYGTGWYHSHALAQYGGGLRGPLIIHGPTTSDYDIDQGSVMVDEKLARGVFDLANSIAKTQGALPAAHNVLFNGMNTVPSTNKTGIAAKWVVQSGKKYLFRIINSSAQSAYALRFDHHNMTVVSSDFVSVTPYTTEWLYISSGQRYNVIIEANQPSGAYFLRAVSQTGCGGQCLNDGKSSVGGNAVIEYADAIGAEPYYGGNLTATFNVATDCKDEPLASLKPYVRKPAGNFADFSSKVQLLPGGSAAFETFSTGNAVRWYLGPPTNLSINSNTTRSNKAINVTFEQPTLKTLATVQGLNYSSPIFSNAVSLERANQWVYFVIQNNFQTAHPMHLHGHDFSVLGAGKGVFDINTHGGQLDFTNPTRRDTTNLFGMPVPVAGGPPSYVSGWTVIGFETDNPGAWVMHCHILWHADGGMGLQYLERPGEIQAEKYYNSEFMQQCKNVEDYHLGGGKQKAPYEAGLKRHMAEHAYHYGHSLRDFRSY